jgi:hypothetical protein
MCDPMSAAAIVATAVGSKMQADAANDAAERQQDALNAQLEQQDIYNRQAESKAMENAQEYAPEKRAKRFEEAQQEAGDSLVQSLVKSREATGTPDQTAGRVSETFESDRATKMADQFQKSVDMARLMGKMRGTQDMLGNEAITNGDYASQLGTIGRNASGSWNAAQPGITAAGRVNSGQMAMGGLLGGLGSAGMSSGLGSAFGNVGTAAKYGTNIGSAQTGMLAAQDAAFKPSLFKMMG